MIQTHKSFSSYSVDNLEKAMQFYRDVIGVKVDSTPEGLEIKLGQGQDVFLYPKKDHQPASFTVLNFNVPNIKTAIAELRKGGVTLETYTDPHTNKDGIFVDGPMSIAWFKDPAGNILSVIEDKRQ